MGARGMVNVSLLFVGHPEDNLGRNRLRYCYRCGHGLRCARFHSRVCPMRCLDDGLGCVRPRILRGTGIVSRCAGALVMMLAFTLYSFFKAGIISAWDCAGTASVFMRALVAAENIASATGVVGAVVGNVTVVAVPAELAAAGAPAAHAWTLWS